MNKEIETLLSEQLSSWETAQNNYAALKRVRIKDVKVNGCLYRIQFKRHSFRRTLPDIGQPISYLSQALDSSRATTC